MTLGSTCPSNITHATTLYVTWCTAASTLVTGDYALYRVTSTSSSPTCSSSGKVKWVDYIQPTVISPSASTPFCLPTTSTACSGVLRPTYSLPMLHVIVPVDINGPSSTIDKYNLVDDIAIRHQTGGRS